MHPILAKLHGTDRRSIGRADEVAAEVLAAPALFPHLIAAMTAPDPVLRMRAADAAEKASAARPELLAPFAQRLLGEIAAVPQQEVRWHVAQMVPRLPLSPSERAAAVELMLGYLGDTSRIVQTCAMQAMVDLTEGSHPWRPRVIAEIERLTATGSPAVRSRGRRLLATLARSGAASPSG